MSTYEIITGGFIFHQSADKFSNGNTFNEINQFRHLVTIALRRDGSERSKADHGRVLNRSQELGLCRMTDEISGSYSAALTDTVTHREAGGYRSEALWAMLVGEGAAVGAHL
jgi:hypothetical protein